jgi:hypothetical protein
MTILLCASQISTIAAMEVAQVPFGGARPLDKPARQNLSVLEVRQLSGRLSMAQSAVPKILAAIGR